MPPQAPEPQPGDAVRGGGAALPARDPRETALARTLGIPDLMARVLLARGFDDPDRVRSHLRPALDQLHDPFAFAQMERAVTRVRQAVQRSERILIHGDYDVDGISGAVLLLIFFRLMEVDVKVHIPDRSHGYSFTAASLEAVKAGGYQLCISVDNGTNACEYIEKIQAEGCDVVVTDHHGTTENVAGAHTILNPRLVDAGYPDRDLAGVGVAFCLAKAVAASFSRGKAMSPEFATFLLDAMTYVALGTIADVAPLRGQNRILVHHGLRALAESRNPGIRALMDSANLSDRSPTAEDVAFRIAPMINAAGRMGHASDAVDLLVAPGYQEAQAAAKKLEKHNEERRRVERQIVDEVMEEASGMDDRILVLGREGWHAGVLGIVASRVAEELGRPALLLALEGDRARGSGRSGGLVHLREALGECADMLRSHGGHAAAVGLELDRERLDELRTRVNQAAGERVLRNITPEPDGTAEFAEFDVRSMRRMDMLGPFGAGNPRPTFATPSVKVVGHPSLDSRGKALRFRVAQGGTILPARLKNGASRFEEIRALDRPVTLTYVPRLAQWAEEGPIELHVSALHPES